MGQLQVEDVVAVVQPVGDALDDVGEVGVPEEAVGILRHDEGDRHRRPRNEGSSRPVRHIVQLIAASTAVCTSGLTFGEELMTRDTVARDTPASRATSSRVGRPGRHRSATHTSLPPDGSSLVLMIRARSKALAFGVRTCVS